MLAVFAGGGKQFVKGDKDHDAGYGGEDDANTASLISGKSSR